PETSVVPLTLAVDPGSAWVEAPAAAASATPADLRLTSPGIRLAQVKEELIAWVKTLVSAAVYAILIVTFGFQVARVEGQSMAPKKYIMGKVQLRWWPVTTARVFGRGIGDSGLGIRDLGFVSAHDAIDTGRASRIPNPESRIPSDRYAEVAKVLVRVLFLNF